MFFLFSFFFQDFSEGGGKIRNKYFPEHLSMVTSNHPKQFSRNLSPQRKIYIESCKIGAKKTKDSQCFEWESNCTGMAKDKF